MKKLIIFGNGEIGNNQYYFNNQTNYLVGYFAVDNLSKMIIVKNQ